ncbi:MAG: DMT family transporter, partial [Porticoccaceae bacterium]
EKMEQFYMKLMLCVLGALGRGAIVSIYMPMISGISKVMGSAFGGNTVFFAVALITSIVLLFVVGDTATIANLDKIPPLYYLAGVFSALIIVGVSLLIPVLGVRRFMILMIAGQILMAVIAGHFGILGVPKDYISLKKALGMILVLGGIVLSISE